jgi:acetoin:2,6-dichlorophenolindophenol oxidoreductase subunit alpha
MMGRARGEPPHPSVSDEGGRQIYRLMLLARSFDQQLSKAFAAGRLAGWFHSSEGHEATGAAMGLCMRETDQLVPYHRSRSSLFAKGMTVRELAAEFMARRPAESKGRGGDGHIVSPKNRIYGMSGVLGASIPIAAGAAYASQLRGSDEVTFNGFGEGTSNRGAFHEGLNLAAIWDLPIVFICENNLYAEFSPISDQMRVADVAERAAAYGIPGAVVDGNDPEAVLPVLTEAVKRARSGSGPTLIEAKTYRLKGHYDGDPEPYRSKDEVAEWAARDPVITYRQRLLERETATEQALDDLHAEVAAEVEDGIEWALSQPPASSETAVGDIYAEEFCGD